jgi:hypothetical protein
MKETVEENTSTTERVFQDRQYQVLYLYILASEKTVSLVAEWAARCFMYFFNYFCNELSVELAVHS